MALSSGKRERTESTVRNCFPRSPATIAAASAPGSVGFREFRNGQYSQEREVDQQVHGDNRKNAADHRARQVARRIAILLGEIQRALPASIGDHDGLQREG